MATPQGTPMTMIQALRSAMDVMLERDPNVVVFGQDVGYFGGVFRCTEGLQAKYGRSRVFDTPISEGGIVGVAVGMGAYWLRPVAEIQFADDAALRDRRVEHARATILRLQALGAAEHSAEVADVLAEHDDVGIALEHHVHRRTQRLDHRHRGPLLRCHDHISSRWS